MEKKLNLHAYDAYTMLTSEAHRALAQRPEVQQWVENFKSQNQPFFERLDRQSKS